MHTCNHWYIHTYRHTHIHTCMHACMHAYIHTYIHTCVHACVHTCIYTYRCIQMHTDAHTHTHTHTQTESDVVEARSSLLDSCTCRSLQNNKQLHQLGKSPKLLRVLQDAIHPCDLWPSQPASAALLCCCASQVVQAYVFERSKGLPWAQAVSVRDRRTSCLLFGVGSF